MSITNLVVKLKPEEIPEFMRGKFFELYDPDILSKALEVDAAYIGWVHIRNDGVIEFGEPGA